MRYEAKFISSVEDIVSGHRMHTRRSAGQWKQCVVVAALFALVFWIPAYLTQISLLVFLGLIIIPMAFIPVASEWDLRRAARKELQGEVFYALSEEGIEFGSGAVRSMFNWSLITSASIDERGLLLYTGPLSYIFIRARAFATEYFPREELKRLLTEKITKSELGIAPATTKAE